MFDAVSRRCEPAAPGGAGASGPAVPGRPASDRARRRWWGPHTAADGLAAEARGAYDPAAGADPARAGSPLCDDAGAASEASPGRRARDALARLTAAPAGSPLAQAVGLLADAADALGRVEPAEESVDDLGDALLALAHLRNRVDAALLDVLRGFDRADGYRLDGAVTAASWLRWRARLDYGTATTLAQAARRLESLPLFEGLLARGDVTLAHVTAVTRACVPGRAEAVREAEPILAELARTNPPHDVRRALRHLANAVDDDGSDTPPEDPAAGDGLRELTLRAGFQGRGALEGTLDTLTREALAVLLDAFITPDPAGTPPEKRRTAPQRRHDAFAAMLHTLLAQPGLPKVQGARPQILVFIDLATLFGLPDGHPLADVSLADLADLAGIDLTGLGLPYPAVSANSQAGEDTAGQPQPVAERTDSEGCADGNATGGVAPAPRRPPRLGSGVPLDPAFIRGLLPAATLMAVLTLGPWRTVNVGRRHRTLPGWLRAVLIMLHRHCRGPGCTLPATWTEAHHLTDWAAGGDTDVNDTLPVCGRHHDDVTTKGWKVAFDHTSGAAIWTSPTGRTIRVPPPPP